MVAYNARDVDAFMACYAEDVVIEDGLGDVKLSGWEAMRERYAQAFADEPDVRFELLARIRHGDFVVDHEYLTGYKSGEVRYAVAIYWVQKGLIQRVRFL
jgi:hypothetical protein